MKFFRRLLVFALLNIFIISISLLPNTSPLKTIKDLNDGILRIYRENTSISEEVVDEIFKLIVSVSNFKYTAIKIADLYKSTLTETEYRDFIDTLEKYLILVFKVRLKRREVVKFEYLGESINGKQAIVKSRTYYKKRKIIIDYLMYKELDRWKVFNYKIEDTDSILSYQKQFTKLFGRYSFATISSKLRIKMTKLLLKLKD